MIKIIDTLLESIEIKDTISDNKETVDEIHYNAIYTNTVSTINRIVKHSKEVIKENIIQIMEFEDLLKMGKLSRINEEQKYKLYALTINPSIPEFDKSKLNNIVTNAKKEEDPKSLICTVVDNIDTCNLKSYAMSFLGNSIESNLTTVTSFNLIKDISNRISAVSDNIEEIGSILIGQCSECNTLQLFDFIESLAYHVIAIENVKVYAYMRAFLQIFQSFSLQGNIITESADISEENVSKYMQELREMIPKCREFFDDFKYKEIITPRKKTINKMNEYMKGALQRKYTLKIPIYKVTNASPEAKEIIENKFIKGLDRIVDKYPNYVLMTPDFKDDDDMFIYITLKEPFGEKEDRKDRVQQSKDDGAVIEESVSFDDPNYVAINKKIDDKQKMIDRICAMQDKYIVKNGSESKAIAANHEKLCDEMDNLIRERHQIANNKMAESIDINTETALSTEDRKNLPEEVFGLPGRRYPLNDITHIRLAISRMDPCSVNEKIELARNIVKQVCKQKLVGKVTVHEANANAKYFPEWMKGEATLDGGYIHFNDKKFKMKEILAEGSTGSTLEFYI